MTFYRYFNNSYNDDDEDNDDNDNNDTTKGADDSMTGTIWDNLPSELKNSIAHQVYHQALNTKHPYAHLALPIKHSSNHILFSLKNSFEGFTTAYDNEDLELSFRILKHGLKQYTKLVAEIEQYLKVIQLENEKSLE